MQRTHREQKPPTIRQLRGCCSYSFAQDRKIAIELTIVERAEGDSHRIALPDDLSWQLEEWLQTLPGGMGVAGRKIHLARPHHQVGQRDFTDRHHLVFGVVQFVHLLFACREILQGAQQGALLLAIPLLLPVLAIALVESTTDCRIPLVHSGGCCGLGLLEELLTDALIQCLRLQFALALAEFPVQLPHARLRLGIQALMAPPRPPTALACTFGPAFEGGEPLLYGLAPFADLGVHHLGLGISVIGIEPQRNEVVTDDVFLQRPALEIGLGQLYGIANISRGHNWDELGRGPRPCSGTPPPLPYPPAPPPPPQTAAPAYGLGFITGGEGPRAAKIA